VLASISPECVGGLPSRVWWLQGNTRQLMRPSSTAYEAPRRVRLLVQQNIHVPPRSVHLDTRARLPPAPGPEPTSARPAWSGVATWSAQDRRGAAGFYKQAARGGQAAQASPLRRTAHRTAAHAAVGGHRQRAAVQARQVQVVSGGRAHRPHLHRSLGEQRAHLRRVRGVSATADAAACCGAPDRARCPDGAPAPCAGRACMLCADQALRAVRPACQASSHPHYLSDGLCS